MPPPPPSQPLHPLLLLQVEAEDDGKAQRPAVPRPPHHLQDDGSVLLPMRKGEAVSLTQSLYSIKQNIATLEETYKAWCENGDTAWEKPLRGNIEFLLLELHTALGLAERLWRVKYPRPSAKPKYDREIAEWVRGMRKEKA